jgi:hypothetical protein
VEGLAPAGEGSPGATTRIHLVHDLAAPLPFRAPPPRRARPATLDFIISEIWCLDLWIWEPWDIMLPALRQSNHAHHDAE